VEGVGGEVKGGQLGGEGVLLMVAQWMRFWLLPSRVSCVLLCPSLLLLLLLCCILLLLVDLLWVLWGPSRNLGSSTAANWVSFDLNVSDSSCWGYSLINTLKLKKKLKRETKRETRNSGQESKSQSFRWSIRVNKQETREDIEGDVFHWFKKNSLQGHCLDHLPIPHLRPTSWR